MPLYQYKNFNTDQTIELNRSIKDRDVPPTLKELVEAGIEDNEGRAGPWQRQLSTGIDVRRSNNWGFGKGYWGSATPNKRTK